MQRVSLPTYHRSEFRRRKTVVEGMHDSKGGAGGGEPENNKHL